MNEEKQNYKRQRKSVLWNFFTQVDENTASCDLCCHRLSYKSTTNNLRKHIRRKHPAIHIEVTNNPSNSGKRLRLVKDDSGYLEIYDVQNHGNYVSGSKAATDSLSSIVTSLTSNANADHSGVSSVTGPSAPSTPANAAAADAKTPASKSTQLQPIHRLKSMNGKFNTKLMYLFIKDFQPYRIVEDIGFQGVVSFLSPSYQLPTKSFISKSAIPELYKKCLSSTKELIKTGDVFCVTLEMWTSINSDSFLSLTAHFVNENFKLVSLLLDCSTIIFARNNENFAYEIKKIVNDWGIEEKIQFVVSENDNDIQSAVTDILGYEHFNCFADTMSTVVREAIGSHDVFKIIEKISALVTYFKRNTQLYEKIMLCQKEAGETNIGLKQVSDMRCFRSIYFMLERFVKLESAIKDILEVIDDDIAVLTDDEWKITSQLCQILRPFESVIMTISSEKYCPASIVIPVVNGLHSVCDNLLKKSFTEPISKAVSDVKEAISNHLGNIESSATLSVCTFLDPRFKNLAFSSKDSANHAKEVVISALTSSSDDKVTVSNTFDHEEIVKEELTIWHVFDQAVAENRGKSDRSPNKTSEDELSVWSTFDNTVALSKPKMTAATQALAEIHRYLEAEILPRQENPLDWWKENKQFYPQLSTLARSQLCATSTSVPCERIFTKAGLHLTERRSKLSERNTKMLVFLNANL